MPTTVTILVFGCDVGILLVAAILYAVAGRREFGPSIFCKANTVAQVTAVAVVLLHQLTSAKWVVILRLVSLDATVLVDGGFGSPLCLDCIAPQQHTEHWARRQMKRTGRLY